jgi:hypothetical protein
MEDTGKYTIDGKEIEIDYNEDISLDKLNDLKRQPISALDMFYVRKHLHQFSHWADDLTVTVDDRILRVEKGMADFLKTEIKCRGEVIPEIAATAVHDIVNGSLSKMNIKLETLIVDGAKVHKRLDIFNIDLLSQIKAVGDKTIYGWVINSFKKHFIWSSITALILSGFIFAFLMATFHVNNFTDMFNKLWNFFK